LSAFSQALALHQAGRLAEAEQAYLRVLDAQPNHPDAPFAHNNRGAALKALRRLDEALASYDKAIALKGDYADAFHNRANVLRDLKRFDEALASYDKALAVQPTAVETYNNRGHVLWELKRFEEALASFDRAVALKPDHAEVFNSRGGLLQELKRLDAALASYERAIALKPDYAEAFNNRGMVLRELKRFDEALASYDKAIALRPNYANAFNNRGSALQELKRFDEALANYAKALALRPDHPQAFGGMVGCAKLICDWRRSDELASAVAAHVSQKKSIIAPFFFLSCSSDAALQLQCARTFAAQVASSRQSPWPAPTWRHGRVRIAYLSADFRDHAVSYLMAGLFESHDRTRFEIFGISFGPDSPGEMRLRLKAAFDRFIDVRGMSDRAVADLLRELEVDIAVDLMGFTSDARSGVFALRPAPVQINYLGFPGTMGAPFMDYMIADRFVIPPENQGYYAEKVVYLPDTFQANDDKRRIGDAQRRAELGLPDNAFVFCAFNNSYKLNPAIFDIWMRLLEKTAGSVLWLQGADTSVERNLRREAEKRGITPDRLIFAPRAEYANHLARYQRADLFLDTLPFNAGATASDALWAGLPVVTCAGEAFAARMAGSLLNAVGLPELVTRNLADYEALALALARDPSLLAGYRDRLATNRLTHPLFDTDRFRRNIEAAYLQMWEIWQRGEPPRSFAVEEAHC
jgi:protein O-GlcNAc transferase